MLRCGSQCSSRFSKQRNFFFLGREIHLLAHAVGSDVLGLDHEFLGLVHVFVGEFQHAVTQCGREQHALAFLARRHPAQQVAHVLDEAEVEHAIGLVDHESFDRAEAEDVLLEVVDQAAGRRDDHVTAVAQLLALLVVVDATVDQRDAQSGVAADRLGVLVDLDRQLAGRRDDHGARIVVLALRNRRPRQQPIHHRDQERAGLAGAGLGLTRHVAPFQRNRQGQRLDGGATRETAIGNAGGEMGVQVEVFEKSIGEDLVGH